MSKKKVPFRIPQALLEQIDECSNGGFVLLSVDENGSPQVSSRFDNPIVAIGLIRYAVMWSQSIDRLNEQAVTDSILDDFPEDENSDSDGDGPEKPGEETGF